MDKFKELSKQTIDMLPKNTGVYLLYPKPTSIAKYPTPIYIGKAVNIRDRVKTHLQQPSYKDNLFIDEVEKVGFIETNSEIEALILEAKLIKKYLPKFNITWRDDKNYFYVVIAQNNQKIPYIYITHQIHKSKILLADRSLGAYENHKSKVIGPFVEGDSLKKTLKFLRRIFPYYTTPRHSKNKCAWCHLDLCPGPELFSYDDKKNNRFRQNYIGQVKKLILVLRGKRKNVLNSLKKEMIDLSKKNKFEEAGKVRDKICALEQIMAHTHLAENQNSNLKSQGSVGEKWLETEKMLQGLLNIKNPIERIECYDVSNIQGKSATGSMVVFVNGEPDKSQYRKFGIRVTNTSDTNLRIHLNTTNKKRKRSYELLEEKPNDIAMLKQVLIRRFSHREWQYPEVILIDGGKAQFNIAIKIKNKSIIPLKRFKNVIPKKGINALKQIRRTRIISIAKGKQELFIENSSLLKASEKRGNKPIPLKNLPQDVYNLIKHLANEAHRFAISYHKLLRSKKIMGRNA